MLLWFVSAKPRTNALKQEQTVVTGILFGLSLDIVTRLRTRTRFLMEQRLPGVWAEEKEITRENQDKDKNITDHEQPPSLWI